MKTSAKRLFLHLAAGLLAIGGLWAQDTQAPPAPAAPAAPAPPKDFWHSLKFYGLVDGYASKNFNDPDSGINSLHNFDTQANNVDLNFAKFAIEKEAAPIGFRFDIGAGRTSRFIYRSVNEQGGRAFEYIEQAYVSVKPPAWKGFQVDFGKFVTTIGAEVIETHSNWNYSRSLLFAWAIPYYHLGLRTQMPIGKFYTAGFQLVNGWNNVKDNNSGKSVVLTGALATSKVSWFHNYMVGPEKTDTNKGMRQLFDTTVLLTPNPKINFYVNADWGREKNLLAGDARWYGIAGAAKFQATKKIAITPRLEWFKDRDGFSTGVAQALKEFTLTGEYKLFEGKTKLNSSMLGRLEFRRDWSDQPFFDQSKNQPSVKDQNTFLVGAIWYFEPKK